MTEDNANVVTMWTDGACSGNPGPGGWGALLKWRQDKKEVWGGEAGTTNNRMELRAAIEGLSLIKRKVPVVIYTDSTYVRNGITKWIKAWKSNGWRTKAGSEVKNVDLWGRLDALSEELEVDWRWVKGHAGDPGNERADALARRGVEDVRCSDSSEKSRSGLGGPTQKK